MLQIPKLAPTTEPNCGKNAYFPSVVFNDSVLVFEGLKLKGSVKVYFAWMTKQRWKSLNFKFYLTFRFLREKKFLSLRVEAEGRLICSTH